MIRFVIVATSIAGVLIQQPTFRGSVQAVVVNASVICGGTPKTDLRVADFEVLDNGVRQTIDLASLQAIPVDLTVIVDLSGSAASYLSLFRQQVAEMSHVLRPIDHIRLMTFDALPREVLPLSPADVNIPVERLRAGSFSAIYDATAIALMRTTMVGRQSLVVAFTDGFENWSIVTGAELREIARRSRAVLHVVAPKLWVPVLPDALAGHNPPRSALEDAIVETGGALHDGSSMVSDLRKILRDFTAGYLLYFVPAGVEHGGWHRLSVSTPLNRRCTVVAKPGYFGG